MSELPIWDDRYVCRVCGGRCAHQRRMTDFIARSTRESGVPYYVQDAQAIEKVAVLLGRRS